MAKGSFLIKIRLQTLFKLFNIFRNNHDICWLGNQQYKSNNYLYIRIYRRAKKKKKTRQKENDSKLFFYCFHPGRINFIIFIILLYSIIIILCLTKQSCAAGRHVSRGGCFPASSPSTASSHCGLAPPAPPCPPRRPSCPPRNQRPSAHVTNLNQQSRKKKKKLEGRNKQINLCVQNFVRKKKKREQKLRKHF